MDFAQIHCVHCAKPQCKAACPVGYDIPQFLQQVKNGEFDAATKTVGHLFGGVCGSVCPREQQCKGGCILNARGNPVDPGQIERQVFEQYFPALTRQSDLLKSRKIAVIGGGVSGVTFAAESYKHGADVTIYEKTTLLNTLYSIPSFRLSRNTLQNICQAVKDIPVVQCEVLQPQLQTMLAEFDVVYLSVGATVAHTMNIDGEQYATSADVFLRSNTKGTTIVIGGGNTAMDCARLSRANGNKTVVAYRRTQQDMPAFPVEISSALREGVEFCYNLAPQSVQKGPNGLTVTFLKTLSEGRGKLVLTDQSVQMVCDNLVVATGSAFNKAVYACSKYVEVDSNNCVSDNLYAGGDATGHSLVAQAVADALNASRAVLKKYSR